MMLQVENLRCAARGKIILDDVGLEVAAGCFLGILGPNGAGKSTLLRSLLGLTTPNSGTIRIGDRRVLEMSRREIAQKVAFVPQLQEVFFDFPVADVVAMGRTPYQGRFRPMDKADRFAIDAAVAATGIESILGRNIRTLSGGERQRVLLARALAQETPLLLLDEPTANLDLAHELEALELLRGLCDRGKTVVAVLHDVNLASRFCDRLLLLKSGRSVAIGSPIEVLTAKRLAEVFGVHAILSATDNPKRPAIHIERTLRTIDDGVKRSVRDNREFQ